MSKRGRPRMQRQPIDHGTPELQAKRALLVRGSDPALASYPLGVLLARDVITREQHEAGVNYGRTFAMAIGRKRELGFDGHGIDDIDDKTLAEIEQRHADNQKKLRRLGIHVLRIVEEVCVFGEMRPWLLPDGRTTAGNDDRQRLIKGLDALL